MFASLTRASCAMKLIQVWAIEGEKPLSSAQKRYKRNHFGMTGFMMLLMEFSSHHYHIESNWIRDERHTYMYGNPTHMCPSWTPVCSDLFTKCHTRHWMRRCPLWNCDKTFHIYLLTSLLRNKGHCWSGIPTRTTSAVIAAINKCHYIINSGISCWEGFMW